jgi:hypothetical protein
MTMSEFNNFRDKTLREIRLWAWAAAVLPMAALAGLFFVWTFGTGQLFNIAMVIGETTMFTVAVIWWWWAIFVINKLVRQWDLTRSRVCEVLGEVKEIKTIVKEQIDPKD